MASDLEFNSEVEAGKVISQDPPYIEGYTVKEESTVKIVISKGENIKVVPDVVGKEKDEAEQEIRAEELEVKIVEETNDRIEAGYVIRQEPDAKTELNAGETVTIYVSTGTKQITMENVVGQTEEDAKQRLTELGFEVNIEYQEDTSKENGVVLEQSISSGTTVDDGTEVTLTINRVVETKEVQVIINVEEITGGYIEPAEGETSTESPTVNISVNNERRTGVSKNEKAYSSISFSGKDGESLEITVTITDPVDGEIYSSSKTIRFGTDETVTFTK